MDNITDCIDCPPGMYCSDNAAIEPDGPCNAGHICFLNAWMPEPVYNNGSEANTVEITFGDLCVAGHYCPQGTTFMHECPRGTYNPDRGGQSEAQACIACDAGSYCNDTALTAVSGE